MRSQRETKMKTMKEQSKKKSRRQIYKGRKATKIHNEKHKKRQLGLCGYEVRMHPEGLIRRIQEISTKKKRGRRRPRKICLQ